MSSIEVKGLSKSWGEIEAVKNVSFVVPDCAIAIIKVFFNFIINRLLFLDFQILNGYRACSIHFLMQTINMFINFIFLSYTSINGFCPLIIKMMIHNIVYTSSIINNIMDYY